MSHFFEELDDDEIQFRQTGLATYSSGPFGAALDPVSALDAVHPDFQTSPRLPAVFKQQMLQQQQMTMMYSDDYDEDGYPSAPPPPPESDDESDNRHDDGDEHYDENGMFHTGYSPESNNSGGNDSDEKKSATSSNLLLQSMINSRSASSGLAAFDNNVLNNSNNSAGASIGTERARVSYGSPVPVSSTSATISASPLVALKLGTATTMIPSSSSFAPQQQRAATTTSSFAEFDAENVAPPSMPATAKTMAAAAAVVGPERAPPPSLGKRFPVKGGGGLRPTVSAPPSLSSPNAERDSFGREMQQQQQQQQQPQAADAATAKKQMPSFSVTPKITSPNRSSKQVSFVEVDELEAKEMGQKLADVSAALSALSLQTGSTIGTNASRPLSSLLSSTGSTSALLRTQLLSSPPQSGTGAPAAPPSLPVMGTTSTTVVNKNIISGNGSGSLVAAFNPSFDEYDGDLPDESASPPRVPPGMTPSSNNNNNNNNSSAPPSSSSSSVNRKPSRFVVEQQDSSPSSQQQQQHQPLFTGAQDDSPFHQQSCSAASGGGGLAALGARQSSVSSSVGSPFGIQVVPSSLAAGGKNSKREPSPPAPIPFGGAAAATAAVGNSGGARSGAPSVASLLLGASSSLKGRPAMNARTMFGGGTRSNSRSPDNSDNDNGNDNANVDADKNSASKKTKRNDDENLFKFDAKDQCEDADSPPGLSFVNLSQQRGNNSSNKRRDADDVLSSPCVTMQKQKALPATAAATTSNAVVVARGPSVDVFRFGYAAKNFAPSSSPAAAGDDHDEAMTEKSPLNKKQKQQEQQKKQPPTALQLLQSNMSLQNNETDMEMRNFVGSLKDERGRPVQRAPSSSLSPDRRNNHNNTSTSYSGALVSKNAFLRDLNELAPSSSAATKELLRGEKEADAGHEHSVYQYHHSPSNNKDSPVQKLREFDSSRKNKKDFAADLVPIPSVDIPVGGYVLEASPGTRMVQRWQIDRTPQPLPASGAIELAAGSSTSPDKVRAAVAKIYSSSFPVLPAQKIGKGFSPQKMMKCAASTQNMMIENDGDGDDVTDSEFAPVSPVQRKQQQVAPFTPPSAQKQSGAGVGINHSRLALRYLTERQRHGLLVDKESGEVTAADGSDLAADEEIVIKTTADGDVEVVVGDAGAVSSRHHDDNTVFVPDATWWTARRIVIGVSVTVGVLFVIILLVVGVVVL